MRRGHYIGHRDSPSSNFLHDGGYQFIRSPCIYVARYRPLKMTRVNTRLAERFGEDDNANFVLPLAGIRACIGIPQPII